MVKQPIELVKQPVLTEKSVQLIASDQYTFDVDLKVTKPQVKKLIQEIFKVEVASVNAHRLPRKKRRLGFYQGYRGAKKRVIVTLKGNQSLNILEIEDK